MSSSFENQSESRLQTPGGHSLGNFPNYYEFNKPDERLDFILPKLLDKVKVGMALRILDVGCNDGSLALRLYERLVDQGFNPSIVGFDIDPKLIERANSKKQELGLSDAQVYFFTLNFMEKEERTRYLPSDQSFDLILILSITMWIQLEYGRAGLDEFLLELCAHRKQPQGVVVVEPQPWKCYRSALKRLRHLKAPLPGCYMELKAIGAHDPAGYIRTTIEQAHPNLQLSVLGQTQWERSIHWYQE